MKKELNNDVLINRKILGWEWYKDITTYKLFTHLIYKANYVDDMHRGVKVLRGQVYTGLDKLQFETGLSLQNIKTSLKKLILTSNITSKSTNKYRIITVVKYNDYQLANKQTNKQTKQQLTSELTASKEYKELLNEVKELKKELSNSKKGVNDSDKKVIKEMVFDECKKDYIFNLKEIKQLRLFDDIEVNDLFVMLLIQRTKLKNPAINSKMAITTIYNKLEKLGNSDCIFLLKDAIEGGWKTVYPKDNKQTIPTTRYTGVEMKFEE